MTTTDAAATRELVIVHASDLHVDHDYTARMYGGDGAGGLRAVLTAARKVGADLVLLAGDTFDSHRVRAPLIDHAAATMREFGMPIVLLPGNHDPAVDEAVYHHPALMRLDCLHVLGVTHPDGVHLAHLDLEVWGRPHRDYDDMAPMAEARDRRTRWQMVMAHGHYLPAEQRAVESRPSWLFGDEEIEATGADYIALGHWNRQIRVGTGTVPAWYCGSPDYARAVNVIRLGAGGDVHVGHEPLVLPEGFGAEFAVAGGAD